MDPRILGMLCAPGSLRPLLPSEGALLADDGRRYAIRDGIPALLPSQRRSGWQHFYDLAAPAYDTTLQLGHWLGLGNELRIREQLLAPLGQGDGVVVEVGCGTAGNRPAFGREVTYLGLDLSLGMLRRARRNMDRLGLPSHFVQAEATQLPVRDQQADLVLAMGVLQHIRRPTLCLQELARLAKPGGQILLVDEQRSLARTSRLLAGAASRQTDALAGWMAAQGASELSESRMFGEYYALKFVRRLVAAGCLIKTVR